MTGAPRAADDIACASVLLKLGLDLKSIPADAVVTKAATLEPAQQQLMGACVGMVANVAQDRAGLMTRVKAFKAARAGTP